MCDSIQELESDGQHKQAEKHFIQAKSWKDAVNMYRSKNLWDDAYRVSPSHSHTTTTEVVMDIILWLTCNSIEVAV